MGPDPAKNGLPDCVKRAVSGNGFARQNSCVPHDPQQPQPLRMLRKAIGQSPWKVVAVEIAGVIPDPIG